MGWADMVREDMGRGDMRRRYIEVCNLKVGYLIKGLV